jgi:hypothetical protein
MRMLGTFAVTATSSRTCRGVKWKFVSELRFSSSSANSLSSSLCAAVAVSSAAVGTTPLFSRNFWPGVSRFRSKTKESER